MKQERRTYLAFKITSHRRKMKIRAVEYKGGKCEMCGYDKCISAMEFHHPDPKKKDFHISHGSYGWEKSEPKSQNVNFSVVAAIEKFTTFRPPVRSRNVKKLN